MTEVPGSDWLAGQDDAAAKQQAPELKGLSRWQRKVGVVTHVFTHFPLELVVYTAKRGGSHPRARRDALGADRDACRRSTAQRHAQGDRARRWTSRRPHPPDTMLAAGLR